jgi:(1->4)-alpha-D-glucan 1-alpha-D-glucosylmutase
MHLVDPDNRGPVDYDLRRMMLGELERGMDIEEILKRTETGLSKLWVTYKALHLRRDKKEWFGANAAYTPLSVNGSKKDFLVAYMRGDNVATIAPRWNLKRDNTWEKTTVNFPTGLWRNLLTSDTIDGGRVSAQELLQRFPVALLIKETE